MFNKKYIEINRISEKEVFEIIPNDVKRKWMGDTKGNAYKCVPMNVVNSYGWTVLSPKDFTATWDGGESRDSLQVELEQDSPFVFAASEFGHGILSVVPDFVVRTSKNISLYVRGVPNQIATGLQALDAIVETDWLPFTFTFNYKFLKPGRLTIKKGQPLFTFFPIERGFIESFETREVEIFKDKEFYEDFLKYVDLRDSQKSHGDEKNGSAYLKGKLYEKEFEIINHTKKVNLSDFKKEEM
jgi:hypothetical protein